MSETLKHRHLHFLHDAVLLRSVNELREAMEIIRRRDPELLLPTSREIGQELDELEAELKRRSLAE